MCERDEHTNTSRSQTNTHEGVSGARWRTIALGEAVHVHAIARILDEDDFAILRVIELVYMPWELTGAG